MLFTTALESIFRPQAWEIRGLKIDGKYLSHLRFADDILVCANTPHELQHILQELADESENQVEDKGDDGTRHTSICQQHTDREH